MRGLRRPLELDFDSVASNVCLSQLMGHKHYTQVENKLVHDTK